MLCHNRFHFLTLLVPTFVSVFQCPAKCIIKSDTLLHIAWTILERMVSPISGHSIFKCAVVSRPVVHDSLIRQKDSCFAWLLEEISRLGEARCPVNWNLPSFHFLC
ncbi:hypothetical protein V8F20_005033 [Naviculisporaceae sp. PSN 640]